MIPKVNRCGKKIESLVCSDLCLKYSLQMYAGSFACRRALAKIPEAKTALSAFFSCRLDTGVDMP